MGSAPAGSWHRRAGALVVLLGVAWLLGSGCAEPRNEAGAREGSIVALDATDGRLLWQRDLTDMVGVGAIGVSGNEVHLFAMAPAGLCSSDFDHRRFDRTSGVPIGMTVPLEQDLRLALGRATGGVTFSQRRGDLLLSGEGTDFVLDRREGRAVVRALDQTRPTERWTAPLPDPHGLILDGGRSTFARATLSEGVLFVAATGGGDQCVVDARPPLLWRWLPTPITFLTAAAASCVYLLFAASEGGSERRALTFLAGVAAAAVAFTTPGLIFHAIDPDNSPVPVAIFAVSVGGIIWIGAQSILNVFAGVPPARSWVVPLLIVAVMVPAVLLEFPFADRAVTSYKEGDSSRLSLHTVIAVAVPVVVLAVGVLANRMARREHAVSRS